MCDFISHNKQLFDELDIFIDSLATKEGALIQVLHEAQGIFGYLPKEVQLHVARKLGVAPAKVYGVVTFYSYFTTEPVCFVKGADKILSAFEKQLGIKVGETTSDFKFSLEGLRCLGACGLAPVVTVNGKVYGKVKPDQVSEILDTYRELELNC